MRGNTNLLPPNPSRNRSIPETVQCNLLSRSHEHALHLFSIPQPHCTKPISVVGLVFFLNEAKKCNGNTKMKEKSVRIIFTAHRFIYKRHTLRLLKQTQPNGSRKRLNFTLVYRHSSHWLYRSKPAQSRTELSRLACAQPGFK